MINPPYTTKTGVKIGSRYIPKPNHVQSDDAQLIQLALIKRDKQIDRTFALVFWVSITLGLVVAMLAALDYL